MTIQKNIVTKRPRKAKISNYWNNLKEIASDIFAHIVYSGATQQQYSKSRQSHFFTDEITEIFNTALRERFVYAANVSKITKPYFGWANVQ